MEDKAEEVSALMKALSSPTRLLLLCLLTEGEHSVGDLAARLGRRGASVSQQLALLRHDGLVATRRDGQTVFYSLVRADVQALIEHLDQLFCGGCRTKEMT